MPTWWEIANDMLARTSLETRFSRNADGRVVVNPSVLPKDEADTRLLFEIVADVFAKLEEEEELAEDMKEEASDS